MKLKWLITLLLLISPIWLFATGEKRSFHDSVPVQQVIPVRILKFSPLALAEMPQPSLQFALEFGICYGLSFQCETGWLPPLGSSLFSAGECLGGFKLKTELKHYFNLPQEYPVFPAQYFSFEGMMKQRVIREDRWLENQDGTFSEYQVADHYKRQFAIHVKYGRMTPLGTSGKIILDSYIGLGIRRYLHEFRQAPGNPAIDKGLWPEDYSFLLPSLTLGVKIGLMI
jgi:hypothetical protein